MNHGVVYLVGAGPGNPGLLTVRALELLRSADVVAHDKLVPAAILALANPAAELLEVGRLRGDDPRPFRLHPDVIARAQAGLRVVRLKAGDPMIFGRGAEEAEDLDDAGIPFEIVPGVSAALGAAAYTGIPLTDRRCASSVTFSTGHEGQPDDPALRTAEPKRPGARNGTLVLYMSAHALSASLEYLVKEGRPRSTPAAYVEHATVRAQVVVTATLGDLAARVAEERLSGPAVVIVGDVVNLGAKVSWSERRPLNCRRVLVARARPGDSQIAKELRRLGAEVIETPEITVEPPSDPTAFPAALERLRSFSAVMFACETGVERTVELVRHRPHLSAPLRTIPIVAVGENTILALRRAHYSPRIEARGACREELERHASMLRLGPILLVTSDGGRPSLLDDLASVGATTTVVSAYRLTRRFPDTLGPLPELVVLPSSSACDAILQSPLGPSLAGLPMLAMGPKTKRAAIRAGARDVISSQRDTVPSIIAAALAVLGPEPPPRARGAHLQRATERRAGR